MPANLTPQYLAAEQRFKEAVTVQEKIEALEEMMALIPKHKGTEKMRADLRRRLAKLRHEGEKRHGVSRASALYSVPREGAGQIVMVGAANAGKSSLLARLTNAVPEIGDYPFTTRLPQPGMMPYENVKIQIVDMPPIESRYYEPWMGNVIRQGDAVMLVADLSTDELLDEIEDVLNLMEKSRIKIGRDEELGSESKPVVFKRALLVANKCDVPGARDNLAILKEFFGHRFDHYPVSALSGEGLDVLRHKLFEILDVVRIFTKVPGKKADLSSPPFVLKRGSTVLDLARAVHRDLANSLKFARIWSSDTSQRSVKYDGRMVERTHILEDGDIIELHA